MTTLIKLQKEIIDNYSDDTTAAEINQAISKYFSELKPSKSPLDPTRLGTRSTFISKLRQALLEKLGPLEIPKDPMHTTRYGKFNFMSAKEQLKFQAQSLAAGTNKWVHALEIMPENIANIRMSAEDILALKNLRAKIDTGKLRDETVEIDGNRLFEKLCPALMNPAKRHQLAGALLLVTGRRTVELLMTGDFYLPKGGSVKGYSAIFSGQAKEGLFPGGPYEIPLLAPYWVVKAAFQRLKELYPTKDLNNADINESFSKSINNYTTKVVGLTPHGLRGAYAMLTYELMKDDFYGGKKMSLIGWISQILGHAQPTAAAYYQRMKVVNFTAPFVATPPNQDVFDEEAIVPQPETGEWNVSNKSEQKRVVAIIELMEKRIRLTASSIKTNTGGSMLIINRIMAKNKELIDEYNQSLE